MTSRRKLLGVHQVRSGVSFVRPSLSEPASLAICDPGYSGTMSTMGRRGFFALYAETFGERSVAVATSMAGNDRVQGPRTYCAAGRARQGASRRQPGSRK